MVCYLITFFLFLSGSRGEVSTRGISHCRLFSFVSLDLLDSPTTAARWLLVGLSSWLGCWGGE